MKTAISRTETAELKEWILSLFPNLSEEVSKIIGERIILKLLAYRGHFKDDWCKENNLCPVCVTGGWDCDSDHK